MKKIEKFKNDNITLNKIKGGDYVQVTVASDGSFTDERTVTSGRTRPAPYGQNGPVEVDEFHYTK